MVDLSIIIISCNTKDILKECLKRVYSLKDDIKKEVIVIDNNSSDGSVDMIKNEFPEAALVQNRKNLGFAAANNQGIKAASGRYYLLLNSDAYLPQAGLKETIDFLDKNQNVGLLGCQLLDKEGHEVLSAHRFLKPWQLFLTRMEKLHRLLPRKTLNKVIEDRQKGTFIRDIYETDWIPGCFFMIRKNVIGDIGPIDEDYYLYSEEKDFCVRAKQAGWKVICYPKLRVTHLKGQTAKAISEDLDSESQLPLPYAQSEYMFYRKNFGIFSVFEKYFFDILFLFLKILRNIYRLDKVNYFFKQSISTTKALMSTNFGKRKFL